jgi:hypothetical protein
MNHPADETWMSYLYGELPAVARKECDAHLSGCPACQTALKRWRATLTTLDADQATLALPRRKAAAPRWQPALRWALAASIVLGAGFLAGRAGAPGREELKREVAAAREQLTTELRARYQEDLKALATATVASTAAENRQFLADFTRQFNVARSEERRDFLKTLQGYEDRQVMDSAELRAGITQLARKTGSGFRQAESQLNLLANYLPADDSGTSFPNQNINNTPIKNEKTP